MTDLVGHVENHNNLALCARSLLMRAMSTNNKAEKVCHDAGIFEEGEQLKLHHGLEKILHDIDESEQRKEKMILFTGSNSSGKTSLIHVLLQRSRILPTGAGNTTGRIMQIKYAEMEQSCIYLIDETGEMDRKSLSGVNSDAELEEIIGIYARRPKKEDQEVWCTKEVVLMYPFPLLKSGIVIVDSPGFNQNDNHKIQAITRDFIQKHRPTISFVYSKSSFGDGEVIAFDILLSLFKQEPVPPILFISTNLSIHEVSSEDGDPPFAEALEKHHRRRFKMLASALREKQLSMYLRAENFVTIDNPSVLEYIMNVPDVPQEKRLGSEAIYTYFCARFGTSIASAMPGKVCETIQRGISTFNIAINKAATYDNKTQENTLELEKFESSIMATIEDAMGRFKQLFLVHIEGGSLPSDFSLSSTLQTSCSVSEESREHLENALLDRLSKIKDNQKLSKGARVSITGNLEDLFSINAERLYKESLIELADNIYLEFGKVMKNRAIEVRQMFRTALQKVSIQREEACYPKFLPRFMQRPVYEMYQFFSDLFTSNQPLTLKERSKIAKDVTDRFVNSVHEMEEDALLPENIRKVFRNIGYSTIRKMREDSIEIAKMRKVPKLLKLTPEYAELATCALALDDYLRDPSLKEASEYLPNCGSLHNVYHVKLSDRVIIKRVPVDSHKRAFKEVHLLDWARLNDSKHIIKLVRVQFSSGSINTLKPVGIDMGTIQSIEQLLEMPNLNVDLVLERFDCDLRTYLSNAVYAKHDVELCLKIMQSIAIGVSELHAINIIHRNLCQKNILVSGKKIIVADLGVDMDDMVHATPDTYTNKADIFSLGLLFAELLVKLETSQDVSFKQDMTEEENEDLIKMLPELELKGKNVKELIISMINLVPTKRPGIKEVLIFFEELLSDQNKL